MLQVLLRVVVVLLALVGALAVTAAAWFAAGGISARATPGRAETVVARRLRAAAIPRAARDLRAPVAQTRESLRSGLEHFADHCAVCHANDGSGDAEMGKGLYPPAPDMRKGATQDLTDGELFYIIENGVRFTGMPAWATGTSEGETASWHLVQFIRHLPKLTDAELEEMKGLNPKSADQWREEEEMRRFLSEEDNAPAPPRPRHRHGEHQ